MADVKGHFGLILGDAPGTQLQETAHDNTDGTYSRTVFVQGGTFGAAKGTKTLGTRSIGTTATLALAANSNRKEAILTNPSTSVTVYLGPAGVTTGTYTLALGPGASYIDDASNDAWYAIVAAGTQQMNVTEVA